MDNFRRRCNGITFDEELTLSEYYETVNASSQTFTINVYLDGNAPTDNQLSYIKTSKSGNVNSVSLLSGGFCNISINANNSTSNTTTGTVVFTYGEKTATINITQDEDAVYMQTTSTGTKRIINFRTVDNFGSWDGSSNNMKYLNHPEQKIDSIQIYYDVVVTTTTTTYDIYNSGTQVPTGSVSNTTTTDSDMYFGSISTSGTMLIPMNDYNGAHGTHGTTSTFTYTDVNGVETRVIPQGTSNATTLIYRNFAQPTKYIDKYGPGNTNDMRLWKGVASFYVWINGGQNVYGYTMNGGSISTGNGTNSSDCKYTYYCPTSTSVSSITSSKRASTMPYVVPTSETAVTKK